MSDYYIRSPEQDESRGPFDLSKLLILAKAGQINPHALYFDEDKEAWVPLSLNDELRAQIFPERRNLSLKINKGGKTVIKEADSGDLTAESKRAAAEGDTEEKRRLTRQKKSFDRAASFSTSVIGLMMFLSALFMILPLIPEIQAALSDGKLASIFNYPTLLIGVFDLSIGLLLMLSVTEVFPMARGRAMITLGFGLYVGWAIGDPILMCLAAAAGLGIFLATISESLSSMLLAFILGLGGNGYLAYLAWGGRFDGFFDRIVLNLVAS